MAILNPYLVFNGGCADAMRFYERVLGGKLDIKTHGETLPPDQIQPGMADRVMHARLEFGENVLMASDAPINQPEKGMTGFALSLNYENAEEARRIFKALSDGARVTMPIEKTFWSEAFGMLTDRFGTPWMVNTEAATQ